MTYAARTSVNVSQTRVEIEAFLRKHGALKFANYSEEGRAVILFEAHNRRIRFDLPLPKGDTDKNRQTSRTRWRALYLCIKAKLEAVESGIETFEEAFLAHVVMPNGDTVGDHVIKKLEISYRDQKMIPLLPGPVT